MLENGDKVVTMIINRSEAEIKADPKDEHAIAIFPYIPTSRIMIRIKKGYKVIFSKRKLV